jgi:hypothetical protein
MLPGRRRYPQELTSSALTFIRSTSLKHPRMPSDAASTESHRDVWVAPRGSPFAAILHFSGREEEPPESQAARRRSAAAAVAGEANVDDTV